MLVWTIFHEQQFAFSDHGSLLLVISDLKLSLNCFNQNIQISLEVNILAKWKRNMLAKENLIGNRKLFEKRNRKLFQRNILNLNIWEKIKTIFWFFM